MICDARAPPRLAEVLKALAEPERSVITNMLAISSEDRPAIFASFLAAAVDLRSRTGRPHWMLVDEAHHVLPAERDPSVAELPMALPASVFVTVDPASVARAALERVDDLIVGAKMAERVQAFCRTLSVPMPSLPDRPARTRASSALATDARRSAADRRDPSFRGEVRAPHSKVRRGRARRRQKFLFPRSSPNAEPARAKPHYLHADGRRRG